MNGFLEDVNIILIHFMSQECYRLMAPVKNGGHTPTSNEYLLKFTFILSFIYLLSCS